MTNTKKVTEALLRQDFLTFHRRAVRTIMPGVEYLENWHEEVMAAAIQDMIDGDTQRLIINVHPRMGKSNLCSVSLPAFLLLRNPAAQIMCVSYSDGLATGFHNLSRRLLREPWLKKLNPQLLLPGHGSGGAGLKDTNNLLQTTMQGYRMATSFGSGITGRGADFIILDDPNDMALMNSEAHRDRIKETFDQTIATRLNSKHGKVLLVTQRGHPDDLSGHMLEKGGFKRLVIEAVASQDTNYDLGGGRVHFREKGSLIDPRRFGPQAIEERKRDLGSRGFEAQYQQNPLAPDGAIFKRAWLKLTDEAPEWEYVVISGDIAGSQGCGDYTAFLVWGYRHPTWHLIAAFRDQVDLPQGIELYRKLDEKYEPDVAVIEANGLGKFFVQRLYELGYRHVSTAIVKGDKHIRAEAITPLLERGEVAILRSMDLYDAFMAELLAFPSTRYDDMVDAFTVLLNRREDVLRMAQRYRRESRRNLPIAPSQQLNIRITNFDWPPVRDRFFERNGRSVFD